MSHRPDTSSSQPRFTTWLRQEISMPSTSSSHLRLHYSSHRVAPSKTQVGSNLALHHPGNPRACIPSGQLQTTSEHHYPVHAELILYRGQRLVVSGHSQSLQLTGLGKSLPSICQQQPRLNYKKTAYSAHTNGAPGVPSLGDRRDCATEPYRTPTTVSHNTKTRSQSSSASYIETNTGGWQNEKTNAQMNRSKLQKKN